MAIDSNSPRGFAGLESLVSEVSAELPKPFVEGRPAGTAPLPGTSPERLAEPSQSKTGWFIGLGLLALIGVIVVINQANPPKPVAISPIAATSPTYEPAPRNPVQINEKSTYVLQGTDGSRIEVEAPADATFAQLNVLAKLKWHPKEEVSLEDVPPIGEGLLFGDNQIRYCLSEKIRLGGWQITVDSYDHSSVAAFNVKVEDYNARCAHFKYRDGALDRVRARVEFHRALLDIDGRLHRGPRQPEKPPTFKVVSSPKQTVTNGKLHQRCAGSTDVARCEALEVKLDLETPDQKRARQQRLDDERNKAMFRANGG